MKMHLKMSSRKWQPFCVNPIKIPLKILLTAMGRSPSGESLPPSIQKPSPNDPFINSTSCTSPPAVAVEEEEEVWEEEVVVSSTRLGDEEQFKSLALGVLFGMSLLGLSAVAESFSLESSDGAAFSESSICLDSSLTGDFSLEMTGASSTDLGLGSDTTGASQRSCVETERSVMYTWNSLL